MGIKRRTSETQSTEEAKNRGNEVSDSENGFPLANHLVIMC